MTGDKGTSPTLTAAIRRVLSGDVESYEVIHKHIDRPLRAFIASHFYWAGPDFVEEVAVRTHEYAVSRLSEYDAARSSPQTWLCWLSRSVASQVMREWFGSRLVQYDESVHEAWAATVAGPAEIYEERRLSRVLGEEKSHLPEDERHSVELHDEAGLTFEESAEASGLSVMQVRYRRRRALAVLKRRLQERGVRPVEVDSTPAPVWHGWAENGDCTALSSTQALRGTVPDFPRSATQSPTWYHDDRSGPDDDYTSSVTAVLPTGPTTLVGAAAATEEEESVV